MPTYSHSRLETYQNCPRQFKLQYIDKPEVPEFEGIEAFMGSRVHEALEKLHKDLILTKLNSLKDLEKFYQEAWEKEWTSQVRIVKQGFTKKHYFDTGFEAVKKYYARYHPFNQSTTVATEDMITINIDGYSLRGFIDRLTHNGKGLYEIHDYKTSGRLPQPKHFTEDRQLALYSLGVKEKYPDAKDVRLIWHYLVFDQEFASRRSEVQLKDLKKHIVSLIKTIEKDEEFTPRESKLCDWCAYPEYCPAKTHQIKTQSLPPNKYLAEPGVKLVNQYSGLKNKISELNAQVKQHKDELELIETAAIAYAKREKTTKLTGSDACLKVERFKALKFPRANDEGREELEEYVRKAGLWEEASSLNLSVLDGLIKDEEADPKVKKGLLKFTAEVEGDRVKLVKKKNDE
ncbi:MAG: PD-(D/E)XK nuclease family protein [bacterium]|nr:PD-(D/E)XK nuclease family protein [bacterium]